jgi:dUTP pyrophosphatase
VYIQTKMTHNGAGWQFSDILSFIMAAWIGYLTVHGLIWIVCWLGLIITKFISNDQRLIIHAKSNALVPRIGRNGDAGYDLCASESGEIDSGCQALVDVGCRVKIPVGFAGQIWPRSGLAVKLQLDRRAGLIDSNYRGSLKVCLRNESEHKWSYNKGDRIAQLVIVPVLTSDPLVVDEKEYDSETTARGASGFGSSGR